MHRGRWMERKADLRQQSKDAILAHLVYQIRENTVDLGQVHKDKSGDGKSLSREAYILEPPKWLVDI